MIEVVNFLVNHLHDELWNILLSSTFGDNKDKKPVKHS